MKNIIRSIQNNCKAVSPLIAVLLLVAIAVGGATSIGIFVSYSDENVSGDMNNKISVMRESVEMTFSDNKLVFNNTTLNGVVIDILVNGIDPVKPKFFKLDGIVVTGNLYLFDSEKLVLYNCSFDGLNYKTVQNKTLYNDTWINISHKDIVFKGYSRYSLVIPSDYLSKLNIDSDFPEFYMYTKRARSYRCIVETEF